MLTTECVVSKIKTDNKETANPMAGMMGM